MGENSSRATHRLRNKMLGQDDQWVLLSLVFGWADGKTLSTSCCVCKQWLGIARQEHYWKDLCIVHWPSSATHGGRSAIRAVGGYQKYYALRIQAQEHVSVPRRRPQETRLGMADLIIFLDVVHHGTTICSLVIGREEMKPIITAPNAEQGLFRFGFELIFSPHSPPSQNLTHTLSSGLEHCRWWKKHEVKDFRVSWAVMEKHTHKMLQVLLSNKGTMVGSTCTFKDWLPSHSSSISGNNDNIAEVDIICHSISRAAAVGEHYQKDGKECLLKLLQLKFGFMICQEWRYFTQLQACRYLQHIFDHEM